MTLEKGRAVAAAARAEDFRKERLLRELDIIHLLNSMVVLERERTAHRSGEWSVVAEVLAQYGLYRIKRGGVNVKRRKSASKQRKYVKQFGERKIVINRTYGVGSVIIGGKREAGEKNFLTRLLD